MVPIRITLDALSTVRSGRRVGTNEYRLINKYSGPLPTIVEVVDMEGNYEEDNLK